MPESTRAIVLGTLRGARGLRLQMMASDADPECKHGAPRSTCSICLVLRPTGRIPAGKSTSSGRKTPKNSATYFGHPWSEWLEMVDAGIAYLIECAKQHRTASYGELWEFIGRRLGRDIGNSWRQIPQLLGYISERSFEGVGLFLTALVIEDVPDGHPEQGFFRLAANRGALPDSDAPPTGEVWTLTPAQRRFWEDQVAAVFAKAEHLRMPDG